MKPKRATARDPAPARTAGGSRRDGPKQIIITTGASRARIEAIARDNGLSVIDQRFSNLLGSTIALLEARDGRNAEASLSRLAALPEVSAAVLNDTYSLQEEDYEPVRFAPKAVNLEAAAGRLTGKNVRIAIIDTDVDQGHPVLEGVALERFDGLAGSETLQRRHGTAVAGLISGRRILKGTAPDARLLIARAFDGPADDALQSDTYVLLSCLDWAASKRAAVVNMSFAGPPNALFEKALAAAQSSGIVLVAAAGNNGPEAGPAYPAAYDSTLAVTATDVKNRIYRSANHGDYIFISAPGVDILAPTLEKRVEVVSGTSFAAALVSGIVSLEIERRPDATVAEWSEQLSRSAQDLGARGRDRIYGYGLIDVSHLATP